MEEKLKILVCGDVEGKFNTLFSRIETINKKSGPFDMLLCVGNFFGVNNSEFDDYKRCLKQVAIPTYVLGPNKEEHAELYPDGLVEFCPNVVYLGKRGVFKSSGGLKIAYLSGVTNLDAKGELKSYEFNKTDVVTLRDSCIKGQPNFRGMDILLTSVWPKNVHKLDPNSKLPMVLNSSDLISWLVTEIKPRYHVSGMEGHFYERPPYRITGSQGEKGEIATRFIGLARVGNSEKQQWIYALNLSPVDRIKLADLYQQTTDETECPYDSDLLSHASETQPKQFFYNMDAPTDDKRKRTDTYEKQKKKLKPSFDQRKCWFCLSSETVEKHLVITVGDEIYLALTKGGLVTNHLLILPVGHYQSFITLPNSAKEEINKFKKALTKFFYSEDKVPVFFERNFKTSHLQINVIPVHKHVLKELLKCYQEAAEQYGFTLNELPPQNRLDQLIPSGCPYFCVELPDVTLYSRCKLDFPLQFGREVLAGSSILNVPEKSDWKNCILPRSEENQLVLKIRNDFQPFNFTKC